MCIFRPIADFGLDAHVLSGAGKSKARYQDKKHPHASSNDPKDGKGSMVFEECHDSAASAASACFVSAPH